MISINYRQMRFLLTFEKSIVFQNLPSFYFRSLLGRQLRRLVCIFRNRECETCALRFTCPYSVIFETPLREDQTVLKGINFGSHPFVIFTNTKPGQSVTDLELTVTLIGESHPYLPMIFLAIKNGGAFGIFKSRVKYQIKRFFIDDYIALNKEEQLIIPPKLPAWQWENLQMPCVKGKLFIEFLSPFRFKKKGRFSDKITLDDVIIALNRRLKIIHGLYVKDGNGQIPSLKPARVDESNSQMQWIDYSRYSARQKSVMKMGGMQGILSIEGTFDAGLPEFLKAGEIFHIGKNTSLGLGKIKVTYIKGDAV